MHAYHARRRQGRKPSQNIVDLRRGDVGAVGVGHLGDADVSGGGVVGVVGDLRVSDLLADQESH